MPFEPDIIVTRLEGSEVALVVEAKTMLRDLHETERQLRKYMAGVGCPVGLIVTPEQLFLYRDFYLSCSEDSIRRVAEFHIRGVLHFEPSRTGERDQYAFEEAVQSWIERLKSDSEVHQLPKDLKLAVQDYILPAILQGDVRAGHPRPSLITQG